MKFDLNNVRDLVRYAAWIELALGLSLSAAAFVAVDAQVAKEARAKFEAECSVIEQSMVMRLSNYEGLLLGLSGFMRHARHVARGEFREYVTELDLRSRHIGVTTLNFARHVRDGDKKAFLRSVREDRDIARNGYPNFSITPAGERASYHPFTYVEPQFAARSLFGVDLQACCEGGAPNLAAMRDGGGVVTSPVIIAGSEDYQLGMRLATYRAGAATNTVEQRREALTGSVGLRFSLSHLLQSALPANNPERIRVRMYSYHYPPPEADFIFTPSKQNLLIDSAALWPWKAGQDGKADDAGERLKSRSNRLLGDRMLDINFEASVNEFSGAFDRWLPYHAAALGAICTLLLFALLRSLLRSRVDLEEAVRGRTRDLTQASEKMRSERDQRIRLEREILNVAEDERSLLGRELHDDLGQTLAATACLAQSLSQDLESRWAQGAAQASLIERHISGMVEKSRLLAQGLMPLASQVGTISVALEQLARHARESYRIGCQVTCNPGDILEDRETARELYRIAQEAVLNAVRHGHATSVNIDLSVVPATGRLRMLIVDNGGGLDEERAKKSAGIGLRIMRSRAGSIGMSLTLERNPEGGTVVRVD